MLPATTNDATVLPLASVRSGDLAVAGGKGANLGELIGAGFPVPPGFVVTTAAYDRFVAAGQLRRVVEEALTDGGSEHAGAAHDLRTSSTPDRGAAIRTAFESMIVPQSLAEEITASYRTLGGGAVAVRSSATAEDLPQAAFAGQQDTYLNVQGEEALLSTVRSCWASLWTDRAIAYRDRLGIDHSEVKLAVVVQRLVAAEAAGVMFTANPVTGARDEVVIDASPGLGEAVVAGLVTPDHHVLRRRLGLFWQELESRPGRRELIVSPLAAGGVEHVTAPESADAGTRPVLPKRGLHELASLGTKIARHFGRPQDVEWAWADGRLFVVQSRPITALPEDLGHISLPTRYGAAIIAEMVPVRPYPLEDTTWSFEAIFVEALGPMLRTFGFAIDFEGVFEKRDGVVVRFTGKLPASPTPALLSAPWRLARLSRRYDPGEWRSDPLLSRYLARVKELDARDVSGSSWQELLRYVHDSLALPEAVGQLRVRYLAPRVLDIVRLRIMLSLLGAGDRFSTLFLTGIPTKTLEANRRLEELARGIRAKPLLTEVFAAYEPDEVWDELGATTEGRELQRELGAFLEEYGHREVGGTVQVSKPTWREAPEVVLGLLKGLVSAEIGAKHEGVAWEVARDEVLARPVMERRPRLRDYFLKILTKARYFPAIREDTRFFGTMLVPSLRAALLEAGRRLTQAGALATVEDVFHLKLDELEAIDEWPPHGTQIDALRETVERRRSTRAELERVPLVDPRYLRPARTSASAPGADVLLRGAAGSPGTATGRVRIVLDGSGFGDLRDGEVLVAPFTNPAWTPLFERAAAVVVDSGGPASHAAIVAREYGIPAVMGAVEATTVLVDGMLVRVDGSTGVVVAVEKQP